MNLLTENPPGSVGVEGGEYGVGLAALDTPVEWNEFCYACLRVCRFEALTRSGEGLNAECLGCGDSRVSLFTRVNSEVA